MQAIIQIVITLIVAGFVLWAARKIIGLVPMDAWIAQVVDALIMVLVVAIVVFYALIPLLHMLAGSIHI